MSENTTPNLQPEVSLPIAPTIGEIDHFRIINKNGQSQKATINQIRELVGVDPNFATDVNAALANKANAPQGATINGDFNDFTNPGLYTLDGGGIANGPVSAGLNWRLIVGGFPERCSQIAMLYHSDRIFFRRRTDNTWAPWRELWHTGNFNPAEKANRMDSVVYRGLNANNSIDECKETGYYFDTRGPVTGTLIVVRAHANISHPAQLLIPYGWAGLHTRSYNTDTGQWSPWVTVYHSGNLGPATTTANGLMSAADKAKLDRL